jgi:hypothetical protein
MDEAAPEALVLSYLSHPCDDKWWQQVNDRIQGMFKTSCKNRSQNNKSGKPEMHIYGLRAARELSALLKADVPQLVSRGLTANHSLEME